jgi:hypothetical protein
MEHRRNYIKAGMSIYPVKTVLVTPEIANWLPWKGILQNTIWGSFLINFKLC